VRETIPGMRYLARLAMLCVVTGSLAACGSVTSPSSLTAFDFTGSIDPLGSSFQSFSVGKTGEMQLTLQSLTPRPVVGFVTVAIGTPVGSVCSPYSAYYITQTAVGQQYAFGQVTKGSYCVLIADNNAVLTQSAAFSIHLLHP